MPINNSIVSKTIGIEIVPNSIFQATSRKLQAQQLNNIYVVEVTITNQQRVWQFVEENTAGGLAQSSLF
jgi:hypothetical protein